nr:reverse transcriptase domain-containing protein [Tanacetum cinerariifolium]
MSLEDEDVHIVPGEARIWLDKEPSRSILTWEDLVSKFINQFFPPSKSLRKTGMVVLVVEINVGGMTADVVDKLTCSSDDVQPKQVDLRRKSVQELCVYLKLFQFHIVDIHIVQDQ